MLRVYETILSTIDDFVYIFDLQGRFLYANPRLLRVWDKTLDQVVGKTCLELGYPDWHAAMHQREIEEVVRTGKPIRGEVPFTGDSGIFGVYDYIFKPVRDAAGSVELIVGTTRDVTDRKRAEEALQESEVRFRTLADAAPMMVWEADAEKQGRYFNQTWVRFTGRSVEQEIGHGWAEGVHPAVDYLAGTGDFADRARFSLPGLIFLDLKLPYKTGFQVLEWIGGQAALRSIPVVVLTSSGVPRDIAEARRLGAHSFQVKPPGRAMLEGVLASLSAASA